MTWPWRKPPQRRADPTRAAHEQAEKTADQLHNELWWIGNAGRIEAYTSGGDIKFGDISVNGRDVTVTEAIQHALLVASPVDLLRRVTAERKILDDCTRVQDNDHWAETAYLAEDTIRNVAEGWGWTEETSGQ